MVGRTLTVMYAYVCTDVPDCILLWVQYMQFIAGGVIISACVLGACVYDVSLRRAFYLYGWSLLFDI